MSTGKSAEGGIDGLQVCDPPDADVGHSLWRGVVAVGRGGGAMGFRISERILSDTETQK